MYRRVHQAPAAPRKHARARDRETAPPPTSKFQKHMSGRYGDIWLSFSIVTLPMLAFSALLLGLVYHYRVTHSPAATSGLRTDDLTDEPGIYYVDLSATVLIFIASWSSTLGPLLAGFLMALASYPLSKKYWNDVLHQHPDLPTPFQFALILKFLTSSGWGSLYSWVKYLAGWKKQRQWQSRLLTASASVTVLTTFLGFLVFLADTWLHITTSTVNFVQVSPVTGGTNYSLTLKPACLTSNNSMAVALATANGACNVNSGATQIFLADSRQTLQTLNNVSNTIAVFNNGPDPTYTYLGIPPSAGIAGRDYTATTFGMRTQCRPISNECNLNGLIGASTPFMCTPAFAGDLQQESNGWLYTYFTNDSMKSNLTIGGVQNPYYYGLAALIQNPGQPAYTANGTDIPELVTPVHGGTAFVLLCSITLYDIEYDSINGTITRLVASPSNNTVANIWQAPMANVNVAQSNLQTAATIAASTANDAQDLADQIALAYSKVALGVGAQSVRGAPALAVQERSSFLVTRLPMAPLFGLIAANLAFVLLGFILTGIALGTSGGEVREIQARLSIVGLVADRFEGGRAKDAAEDMEELFEEHDGTTGTRVGMERTATGGYAYRQWSTITG
ncbi:hypothetical protein AYL99_03850 [Fonsecaea erecta]|uniref:Uncharacterized protein n=1 Tax=Fonsecaea erecta TaxID=1367422 RepID=A0A178ZPD3_9EURO|nr:hypothetical protein AYL99_03850 [Fonsecaea erecta]OAP61647.1 hypothetical protein AYL99_03850 [Fonsecaea erecta]